MIEWIIKTLQPYTHIEDFLCVGGCMEQREKEDWEDAHWVQMLRLITKRQIVNFHNDLLQ